MNFLKAWHTYRLMHQELLAPVVVLTDNGKRWKVMIMTLWVMRGSM